MNQTIGKFSVLLILGMLIGMSLFVAHPVGWSGEQPIEHMKGTSPSEKTSEEPAGLAPGEAIEDQTSGNAEIQYPGDELFEAKEPPTGSPETDLFEASEPPLSEADPPIVDELPLSEYSFSLQEDGTWSGVNPANDFEILFRESGFEVTPRTQESAGWSFGLSLTKLQVAPILPIFT